MHSMTIFFSGSQEELYRLLKNGVEISSIRQNQNEKFVVKFTEKAYKGGRKPKFDVDEIKRLRFDEKLSLGQVAERIGCSRTYVSNVCNGK